MLKVGKSVPTGHEPVTQKNPENLEFKKENDQSNPIIEMRRGLFGFGKKRKREPGPGNVWQRLMKRTRVRGQGLRGREGRVS